MRASIKDKRYQAYSNMWISETKFGIKRATYSFLLFVFSLWFFAHTSIILFLITADIMSIYLCILIYSLIHFGIIVRKSSFKVGDYIYEVLDHIQIFQPKKNLRELKIRGNEWFASKIYLNNSEKWAYLDSIRLILKKLGIKKVNRLLVLGGGCCAIPFSMLKTYPSVKIDVVENNKLFIKSAWKYFLKGFDRKQIKILNIDAFSFINISNNKYDLIIVDLFNGPFLPPGIGKISFVRNLKRLLKNETGILITNLGINLEASLYKTILIHKQILKSVNFYVFGRNIFGVYSQFPVKNSIENIGVKIL